MPQHHRLAHAALTDFELAVDFAPNGPRIEGLSPSCAEASSSVADHGEDELFCGISR
jgi:hypothetical protein